MMSEVFTQLPDPVLRFDAPPRKLPVWSTLPAPEFKENPAPRVSPPTLPAWPVEATTVSPVARPNVWRSEVPAASPAPRPDSFVHATLTPAIPSGEIPQPEQPEFTDADLIEAFGPIVENAAQRAVYSKENVVDQFLEPMLRATIRRALAESTPGLRPFHPPGAFDRFIWHLQALFTSRSYEDIFFEKTHRFQVGEVFLVDAATLALVSFASCDPARHSSTKRVETAVQRLAQQVRDDSGKLRNSFEIADQRNVIIRAGQFVTLLAVVRGQPGEHVIADLDYVLRRIEDRFHDQFLQQGSELLRTLQPYLEDCLLIQAPASAA